MEDGQLIYGVQKGRPENTLKLFFFSVFFHPDHMPITVLSDY